MFRRLFATAAVAALAAALAPAALGVNVHVRVEGKTTTIFGSTEPVLGVRANPNPIDALEAASLRGEFYYHVNPGPFVDQIGRYPGAGLSGWGYKVNGVAPQVAADQVVLRAGDTVLWYWTSFGDLGTSPTLVLRRRARNCYAVTSQDDSGTATPAANALLLVDGRRVRTRAGRGCVGRHRGLVRATAPNAVRSNALR